MLRELRIENLLLIERAELRLGPGLNVLTGETGAGKTVLAHSLDLLMGGKARKSIVRSGAPEAWVEGVFDLPPEWNEDGELTEILDRVPAGSNEVVLGRRVSGSGRTSAFIGGRSASAADLQLLASRLIAFYGQHEHRRLTIGATQLAMVDRAGGLAQQQLLGDYAEIWKRHRQLCRELAQLRDRDLARERDLDLHRFELGEIEAAALEEDEKDCLVAERDRLRHAEGLREAAGKAAIRLNGIDQAEGVSGLLAGAQESLSSAHGVDRELDALADRVGSLALEAEDVAVELSRYLGEIEADPDRLAGLEERLGLIDRLERKHGGSVGSVLAHAAWCQEEISRLEGSEARESELTDAIGESGMELERAAEALSKAREKAAGELATRISADLEELAMPGARLTINLSPHESGPGPSGSESAEFMLAANAGVEPSPLRDTASGGELSRVMLALAASGAGDHRTLVFDEIDAGIGGNTAAAVGDRLKKAGEGGQVLAITHLPQVASRAATHFSIEKDSGAAVATTTVTAIEGEEIVREIRRMMGAGEGDETATRHARELVHANR